MKLKSILAATALLSAFVAGNANAAYSCSLGVNPSNVVLPGHYFSYSIDITQMPEVGPFLPSGSPPFTVVFHGSKDGVEDIPPSGETYPATFGVGYSTLTGYGNPGNVGGLYERHATIYGSAFPYPACTTNSVYVLLLDWGWNL